MSAIHPLEELLNQIAVSLSNEPESKADDTCHWSKEHLDELLHKVAAQLSDEE